MLFCLLFFFFQAEDGIRDAQESRGLGDVYKRQVYTLLNVSHAFHTELIKEAAEDFYNKIKDLRFNKPKAKIMACHLKAVSYTHLTLPTIYSV